MENPRQVEGLQVEKPHQVEGLQVEKPGRCTLGGGPGRKAGGSSGPPEKSWSRAACFHQGHEPRGPGRGCKQQGLGKDVVADAWAGPAGGTQDTGCGMCKPRGVYSPGDESQDFPSREKPKVTKPQPKMLGDKRGLRLRS